MSRAPEGMFPSRFWFSRLHTAWPITRGGDEWGRHTIGIGIPYVTHLVIPWRNCPKDGKCADLAEFACTFPGCPYTSIVAGSPCMTHHVEFWADEMGRP